MIYLALFLAFLKIGAVSFGGGFGMIALIREECLNHGWLGEEELLNFIAIAESTPGPIAINLATFVGSSQGGLLGSLVATLGIILPSFIIIILIASLMSGLLKIAGVQSAIKSVKPCVTGLIFSAFLIMLLKVVFNISTVKSEFSFDVKASVIFIVILFISQAFYILRKKSISPIFLILLSAIIGILIY